VEASGMLPANAAQVESSHHTRNKKRRTDTKSAPRRELKSDAASLYFFNRSAFFSLSRFVQQNEKNRESAKLWKDVCAPIPRKMEMHTTGFDPEQLLF
jgi:hypothetical protein